MATDRTSLDLKHPITVGSMVVTALEFRALKAKDLRDMPTDPKMGDLLDLAGRMCGQTKVVVDELEGEDILSVLELVGSFMPGGRGSGGTPSP